MNTATPAPEIEGKGQWLRTAVWIVGVTLLLSWPLTLNRFPLVYYDTEIYLNACSQGTARFDRPLVYALFLGLFRAFPFGLYAAAVGQAAVTAALLVAFVNSLVPSSARAPALLVVALGIALSPTVFHVTTLMPDIATFWLGLAVAIVLFGRGRPGRWLAVACIVAALLLHTSNILILLLLFPLQLFLSWTRKSARRRLMTFWCLTMLLGLAVMCLNPLVMGGRFGESCGVFFVAGRLHQAEAFAPSCRAVAERQTDEAQRQHYLRFADQMGHDFKAEPEELLWNPNSPLNRDFPGWMTDHKQFTDAQRFLTPVVHEGLRTHRGAFMASGKHNVTSMMAGEYLFEGYRAYDYNSEVAGAVTAFRPEDAAWYLSSPQGVKPLLSEDRAPAIYRYGRLFCRTSSYGSLALVALLPCWFAWRLSQWRSVPKGALASFVLCAIVWANLVVCGFSSSAATRHFERVAALPLVAAIALLCSILSLRSWRFASWVPMRKDSYSAQRS